MAASFTAGAIECILLVDGGGGLPAEMLLCNVPPDERESVLGDRLGPDGRVFAPYQCLLVRADGQVVLVDAGLGSYDHPAGGAGGELEDELRRAGVGPEQIDVVVVTHGHIDHIGGLCRDGRPRFAGARHLVPRAEWDFWTDEARLAEMLPVAATVARDQLPPLAEAGMLELVDEVTEVLDGVRLVPAPGHTPGHVAVELGGRALYLADTIIDELHAEHPDWMTAMDADPGGVLETRLSLLGRAADEELTVAATHLSSPARVERAGKGSRLMALGADT